MCRLRGLPEGFIELPPNDSLAPHFRNSAKVVAVFVQERSGNGFVVLDISVVEFPSNVPKDSVDHPWVRSVGGQEHPH